MMSLRHRFHRLHGSNSRTIKQHNRYIVVRALLRHGPLSRQSLTHLTGLMPSTITNVVGQLIAARLVEELGKDASIANPAGGRHPILVGIRAEGVVALAIQFAPSCMRVALVNLAGNVEHLETVPIAKGSTPEVVVGLIARMAATALRLVDQSRLVGVGVAAMGLVDPATGFNEFVAYHSWRRVPLADLLAVQLGRPVLIENAARAMALAEHWYGGGRLVHDLILINVDESVGAGIIIDGKVYRGETGLAGEIGHMVVVENGPLCDCGNRGCLEAVASLQAIARHAPAAEVLAAAAIGQQDAVAIVREGARPLAQAIANLADVLDPQLVIISGDILAAGALVLATIRQTIDARSLVPSGRRTKVVLATLGPHLGVIGAATLAFEQFLGRSDILAAGVDGGASPRSASRR